VRKWGGQEQPEKVPGTTCGESGKGVGNCRDCAQQGYPGGI